MSYFLWFLAILAILHGRFKSTTSTSKEDIGWVAAICEDQRNMFQCFGALIHYQWVLTIKQCYLGQSVEGEEFTTSTKIYVGGEYVGCGHGEERRAIELRKLASARLIKVDRNYPSNDKITISKLPTSSMCNVPCQVYYHPHLLRMMEGRQSAPLIYHNTTLKACKSKRPNVKGTMDAIEEGAYITCPVVCEGILSGFVATIVSQEFEVVYTLRFTALINNVLRSKHPISVKSKSNYAEVFEVDSVVLSLFLVILLWIDV